MTTMRKLSPELELAIRFLFDKSILLYERDFKKKPHVLAKRFSDLAQEEYPKVFKEMNRLGYTRNTDSNLLAAIIRDKTSYRRQILGLHFGGEKENPLEWWLSLSWSQALSNENSKAAAVRLFFKLNKL